MVIHLVSIYPNIVLEWYTLPYNEKGNQLTYFHQSDYNYGKVRCFDFFHLHRDWCKKKRTGLDLAMKMDAFLIY